MKRSATGSWNSARPRAALAAAAAMLLAACAGIGGQEAAQWSVASNPANAVSIEQLDLSSDPIPPILVQARKSPYALTNTGTCERIGQEMALLNAVLGEDYDTATARERRGENAGEVLATLIPFRGVIREVSGANRHEREFRDSISAGLMRRAYLKGRGEQMGCAYPARPFPVGPVSDPGNFDDLADPPAPEPPAADPRRMVRAQG